MHWCTSRELRCIVISKVNASVVLKCRSLALNILEESGRYSSLAD
jgi:hypothetical protein